MLAMRHACAANTLALLKTAVSLPRSVISCSNVSVRESESRVTLKSLVASET